jgi:hypothetical protein
MHLLSKIKNQQQEIDLPNTLAAKQLISGVAELDRAKVSLNKESKLIKAIINNGYEIKRNG